MSKMTTDRQDTSQGQKVEILGKLVLVVWNITTSVSDECHPAHPTQQPTPHPWLMCTQADQDRSGSFHPTEDGIVREQAAPQPLQPLPHHILLPSLLVRGEVLGCPHRIIGIHPCMVDLDPSPWPKVFPQCLGRDVRTTEDDTVLGQGGQVEMVQVELQGLADGGVGRTVDRGSLLCIGIRF